MTKFTVAGITIFTLLRIDQSINDVDVHIQLPLHLMHSECSGASISA